MTSKTSARPRELLESPAPGEFGEQELAGLAEPVTRFFRAAIDPGAPLARAVHLEMKGQIKVGRWLPFRATEVLAPRRGFLWSARAAGLISGYDRYLEGKGEMSWKLAGLIPVMRAGGPDVSRSAAERAAAEAIWVPTSLLPRFGVEWVVHGNDEVVARFSIGAHPIEVSYRLDAEGRVESVVFQRWGDPDVTGDYALHPFGGDFDAYRTFDGVTVPSSGRLGWHYGTDRWDEGEFFRFTLTDLRLVG